MVHTLVETVTGFILAVISGAGYAGVALLMAIESACIPLPSEIIMPFAGYLVSTGRFSLVGVATAGAVGCNIGSTLAYLVGARGGRALIDRLSGTGLLQRGEVEAADRFFARYGSATVFVGRLLPVVRTFIALPAGVARMPQLPFQLYTFVGSWLWCYALATVGEQLGARWNEDPTLRDLLHQADIVIVALVVLGAAWFVWHRLRRPAPRG